MDQLIEVAIPVDAEAAALLSNPHKRVAIGRVISRLLAKNPDPLLAAMEELGTEARRRGLTQEILDEELAAYNAERREADDRAA